MRRGVTRQGKRRQLQTILETIRNACRMRRTVPSLVLLWLASLCSVVLPQAGQAVQADPLQEQAAPTAPENHAPHIVFDQPVHDFGTAEQGTKITHLFRFTNQGGRDLRVESVKTSCGCTAAIISADVIPPGGEGSISATFDTARFFGEKVKTVNVYSNDPLQPVTTLTLQGMITVEVAVEPPQLYIGRLRRGAEITHTIEVSYDAAKPITITKVENTHPAVAVQTAALEQEGKQGKKLLITVTQDAPFGRLNDQITVTTTSAKRPSIVIPVFGSIEGDLLILPPQASFGIVQRGTVTTRQVSIKNTGANPVQVLRVQSSVASVVPEITPVTPGQEYRLTLKVSGDNEPGRIQGKVQVFTDHPEEKVLTILLHGVIAEPRQARKELRY